MALDEVLDVHNVCAGLPIAYLLEHLLEVLHGSELRHELQLICKHAVELMVSHRSAVAPFIQTLLKVHSKNKELLDHIRTDYSDFICSVSLRVDANTCLLVQISCEGVYLSNEVDVVNEFLVLDLLVACDDVLGGEEFEVGAV